MNNNEYMLENQFIMENNHIIDSVIIQETQAQAQAQAQQKQKQKQMQKQKQSEIEVMNENIENECSICLDVFTNKNKAVKINGCGHKFHQKCLVKWLQIKPICPYCRDNINGSFNILIHKGNRLFPKKINLLIQVDKNNIYFYNNNKEKNIYKIISFSKLKKITLLNKKVFLIRFDKEQFYFNAKDIKIAKVIYNIISTRFIEFKNLKMII